MDTRNGPVFVVGCARSGTKLLRLMLNAHRELAIPNESHFMVQIARARARGRWPQRLDTPKAWRQLKGFLSESPYLARWNFDLVGFLTALDQLEERTHARVFEALFDAYRDREGKSRWGDKTPSYVSSMLFLDRLFPDARFVHILRDGRDVALSLSRIRSWGPRHLALAGHYWCWRVLAGLLAGAVLGPTRCRIVRYESLVCDPEAELRSLLAWLDLPFDPAVLRYYETRAAHDPIERPPKKRRIMEPPDPSRIGRWENHLSGRQKASVWRQAGPLLSHLGYQTGDAVRFGRREASIVRLLDAPSVEELDRRAQAWTGGDVRRRVRLLGDEALAVLDFGLGRYPSWGLRTIRWQRTVADMLQ